MDLYPAIDLRGGRCVRLLEGDFERQSVYSDDPVAVARSFAEAGTRWIHVVDLDAALTGEPVNRSIVESIARVGVRIQAGGGVRSMDAAAKLIDAGVARVVMGTAAAENTELVAEAARRWPNRIAVGLDHRAGELRVRGWTEGVGRKVAEVIPEVVAAGAAAVIVTDISKDGTLSGPDTSGLAELAEATGAPLIASGGVSSLADIEELAAVRGLIGVITGRAIYEGRFTVEDALAVLSR